MSIFRFIRDHDSLINVLVLLLKIYITKSWSGVSLKIQELYAMVLLARYLDLCGGHRAISRGISLKVQLKQDDLLQVTSPLPLSIIFSRMFEEEEFHVLLSCDEKETLNDVTLKSVETNEHAINEHFAIDGLTPCIYEYWSDHEESEGKLEVSQSEPEIVMAQTYEEEAEKEIEVTLTRPEELQEENKDDQSFVLVNPPTLPYIFDDFEMEVDVKERSKTFCTADTFVLDDLKIIYSYVLEVQDKLIFLNKGISVLLPNAKGESIILGYSLLEVIT
ncbi:hypothetical protein Sjap_022104 [Stephania japonica]|uniref:Uncharacterized protein n=1 Tax=Stephania japonica TaxID=461633 RepID=A0AAP0ERC6_9MAGN